MVLAFYLFFIYFLAFLEQIGKKLQQVKQEMIGNANTYKLVFSN